MVKNEGKNDIILAALAHLSGLFLMFIGPLVFYFAVNDKFAKENSRNALNFQLTVLIATIILCVLAVISIPLMFIIIGIFLFFFVVIAAIILSVAVLVLCLIATIKAYQGEVYKYPFTIEIIK
ncbi:MAG: DUF4870 domain-containing protein [Candidatus ainarchaeum sp.]|nr:DUF4870 domain-containing protein [Candidatus ainarchaeum sp.]